MISVIITAIISFVSTNLDDIFVLMVFFSQVSEHMRKRHIIIGQYLGVIALLLISVLGAYGLNLIPQQYTGLLGIVPIILGVREWRKYRKERKLETNKLCEDESNLLDKECQIGNVNDPITQHTDINDIGLSIKNKEYSTKEKNPITAESITDNETTTNTPFSEDDYFFNEHTSIPDTKTAEEQEEKNNKIMVLLNKIVNPAIINVLLVTIANGADNIGVYVPLFVRLNVLELIITLVIFLLLLAVWCYAGEKLSNFPVIKQTIQKYKNIIVPVVYIIIGVFILTKSEMFSILIKVFEN